VICTIGDIIKATDTAKNLANNGAIKKYDKHVCNLDIISRRQIIVFYNKIYLFLHILQC